MRSAGRLELLLAIALARPLAARESSCPATGGKCAASTAASSLLQIGNANTRASLVLAEEDQGGQRAREVPAFAGATFWQSQPVAPNQTVLVTGGVWRDVDALVVQLVRLDDGPPNAFVGSPTDLYNAADTSSFAAGQAVTNCTVLTQTNYSISFLLPAGFAPGVFAYQVLSLVGYAVPQGSPAGPAPWWWPSPSIPTVVSGWKALNAPDLWFIQGDLGSSASAGGWIGAYGTSLSVAGSQFAPTMLLADTASTATFVLSASTTRLANGYVQYFDVPSSLPVGNYTVAVHNGAGGAYGWTALANYLGSSTITSVQVQQHPYFAWPGLTVNVSNASGATMDNKFASAIARVKAAGGGILYVPAGSYTLTSSLILPSRTILRGAGKGQTVLTWQQYSYPGRLISGDSFGVESLSLRTPLWNQTLYYCTVTLFYKNSASGISWIKSVESLPDTPDELLRRAQLMNCSNPTNVGTAVSLQNGANFVMEDFTVADTQIGIAVSNFNYTYCDKCVLNYRDADLRIACGRNHAMLNSLRNFRGNATLNNQNYFGWQPGLLIAEYCGTSVTRDVYYGNNTSVSEQGTWNDNTNADGKEGWYYGQVLAVGGTKMTLAGPLRVPTFPAMTGTPAPPSFDFSTMLGSMVMVVGGRGMGQYRLLAQGGYDSQFAPISVDRPWDVVPDNTSTIAITKFKGRELVVGNDFGTEGLHQLGWMSVGEVHYVGNVMSAVYPSGGWTNISNQGRFTPGIPCTLTWVSGFRYGDSNTPAFPGFQSGTWYSQAINNVVRPVSNGLWIQFTSTSPNPNATWFTREMGFGLVVRNNSNPTGSNFFGIVLDKYTGASVVEQNTNVTLIKFDPTGSVRGTFRANTANSTGPLYQCTRSQKTYTCGQNPLTITADCRRICSNQTYVFA